jgi:hypothetical protein
MRARIEVVPDANEDSRQGLTSSFHMFTDEVSAMGSIDSLKEAKRGVGVTCRCGKSARITVRGRTLCYECFDEDRGYVLDPAGYAKRRMLERIREIDRMRDGSIQMLD